VLEFRRLQMTNFGPYKGTQSLEFAGPGKVTVVYGENMRGKTTIINAIGYALTGVIVGRGSEQQSYHLVGNWEAAEEGEYGFSVTLDFTYEGGEYEVNRSCSLEAGVERPKNDSDYLHKMYMVKDGKTLGPDDSLRVLSEVMPQQIVRFFLFDAELLQTYEELLRDSSDMGRRIRAAIEKILGIPLLTNSKITLGRVVTEIQNEHTKAASKNARSEQVARNLKVALRSREVFQERKMALESERDATDQERQAVLAQLRRHEKTQALLAEKERLDHEREEIEAVLEAKQEEVREMLSEAWRWVAAPSIEGELKAVEREIKELNSRQMERRLSAELERLAKMSMETGQCVLCEQSVEGDTESKLRQKVERDDADEDVEAADDVLESRVSRKTALERLTVKNRMPVLEAELRHLEESKLRIAQFDDRIAEIDAQVGTIDQTEIRTSKSSLMKLSGAIANQDKGIDELEEQISKNENGIKRLEAELDRLGVTPEIEMIQRRRDMAKRAAELFESAVEVYRRSLKEQIEKDATSVFLALTTEADYGGLRINDNYGLTILHSDGKAIPVRSAGAEHIVALSLIASLQKNAPIRGPVVMDSPFGRLDDEHKRRVVRALPTIAAQSCLLVYRSEVDPEVVRDELKSALGKEYSIGRVSARHSELAPVEGGTN